MPYVRPNDVRSPRDSWNLTHVLREGSEGEHALAIGDWEGNRCLAMRWNGTEEKPAGNPQSRGNGTWFIMPEDYNDAIIGTLSGTAAVIAKALLPPKTTTKEKKMGAAKHQMMKEHDDIRSAQDMLLHAEVLKECEIHNEVYANYGPLDDESLTELVGDLTDDVSFSAVRKAFDQAPGSCFICDKNAASD